MLVFSMRFILQCTDPWTSRIRNVFWAWYGTPLATFQPRKPDGFLLLDGVAETRCWRTTDIASPDTRLIIRSRDKLITHTRHSVVHPYYFHGKYPGWSTNMSCKNSNHVCSEERMNTIHSHYMWPTVTLKMGVLIFSTLSYLDERTTMQVIFSY